MIDRREQALTYTLLGVFSLIALVPIAGIVLTALQAPGQLATFGSPSGFHPGNFATAWDEGNFSSYLRSSVIVAVTVVAASTLLSIPAGYAFGMMRFRGQQALFYLFLLGLMVPLEATIVPLYYDFRDLALTDTYAALILPQVGVSLAGLTGKPYWRPPYGAHSAGVRSAAAAIGYTKTVMWDVDTIDWDPNTSTDEILSRVLTRATSGTIVLMHLGGYHTVDTGKRTVAPLFALELADRIRG